MSFTPFVKPSTNTSFLTPYRYGQPLDPTWVNYVDQAFPLIINNTGGQITGLLEITSTGTIQVDSGGLVNFLSGSATTWNTGSIITGHMTLSGGSFGLVSGAVISVPVGTSVNIAGNLNMNSTGNLIFASGSALVGTVTLSSTIFDGGATVNAALNYSGTNVNVHANGALEVFQSGAVLECDGAFLNGSGLTVQCPTDWLSAIYENFTTVTGTYTVDSGAGLDLNILANTASAGVTINLPITPNNGRIITIKNITTSNNVTVNPGASCYVDNVGSYTMSTSLASIRLMYDNASNKWWIMNRFGA